MISKPVVKVYLFNFWRAESSDTSGNRVRAFYDVLREQGYAVQLVELAYGETADPQKEYQHHVGDGYSVHRIYSSGNAFSRYLSSFLKMSADSLPSKLIRMGHIFVLKRSVVSFESLLEKYDREIGISKEDVCVLPMGLTTFQLVSYLKKEKEGLKIVLDYRDPFVMGYRLLTYNKFLFWLLRSRFIRDEEELQKKVDGIITVSAKLAQFFPLSFASKLSVIENGANIAWMETDAIVDRSPYFKISYLGTVYPEQLSDHSFFEAIALFLQTTPASKEVFKLEFIGGKTSSELDQLLKKYSLQDFANVTAWLPKQEAFRRCYDTSLFLHLKYADRTAIITSKHYDYLALQKPVLLPITDGGELEQAIHAEQSGFVCGNKDELLRLLNDLWSKHQNGESFRIKRSGKYLHSLSRRSKSGLVVHALQKL